jgi:hypothetical protein
MGQVCTNMFVQTSVVAPPAVLSTLSVVRRSAVIFHHSSMILEHRFGSFHVLNY